GRRQEGEPPQRRPQPEQEQAHQDEDADEEETLTVYGRQLRLDGGEDRHDHSAASARSIGGPERSLSTDRSASSTAGGLRLGAAISSSTNASFSRASPPSRWRFHMLA